MALLVLQLVHGRGGVTVQSDFAREHAHTIAALASAGYLTTETYVLEDPYGRVWHATADALRWLKDGDA